MNDRDIDRATRPSGPEVALIAVLLLCAIGWVAGWVMVLHLSDDPKDAKAMSDGAAWLLLAIWFGPPLWAGWLVTQIVRRWY